MQKTQSSWLSQLWTGLPLSRGLQAKHGYRLLRISIFKRCFVTCDCAAFWALTLALALVLALALALALVCARCSRTICSLFVTLLSAACTGGMQLIASTVACARLLSLIFHRLCCRVLKQQRIQELTDALLEIDENISMMCDVMLTITKMTCDTLRWRTPHSFRSAVVLLPS